MADIPGLNTTDAITPADTAAFAATEFVTSGAFTIDADGLSGSEFLRLHRLGPSGNFFPLTNSKEEITLGEFPNTVYINAPGTYRIEKTETASDEVYAAWQEV